MFISVDLPAPFSPSSASTSPRWRSRSTWSFARTPGNRFVIPRSSRTASAMARDSMPVKGERGHLARPPRIGSRGRLQRRRRRELPGDDLRLQRLDLRDVRLRHLRADLAEGDAAVPQVEDDVAVADERPVLRGFDGEVDPLVHPLHGAREDVRAEVGLVDVDTDAPDVLLLRRLERTEPAGAGHVEDDMRAGRDLVERDRLALVLSDEVLR